MRTLFDQIPHSRTKDPTTSYNAVESHQKRGNWKSNLDRVEDGLTRHSGRTAAELASILDMDYHETVRRLGDLKNLGKAVHGEKRMCAVRKNKCVTWVKQ